VQAPASKHGRTLTKPFLPVWPAELMSDEMRLASMSDTDQSRGDELALPLPCLACLSPTAVSVHPQLMADLCSLVTNTSSLSDHKIQIEIKITFVLDMYDVRSQSLLSSLLQ